MALISDDYRRTGKCNAAFAKEPFGFEYGAWLVSKNYSKYEAYQRGYKIIECQPLFPTLA